MIAGKLILVLLVALAVAAVATLFYYIVRGFYKMFSRVHRDKRELLELRDDIQPMIQQLRERNKV